MSTVPPIATADEPVANGRQRSRAGTIVWAGALAGTLDIAYVIVFYGLKGVAAVRILQGVAAGLVGREVATNGGGFMAVLGLAIHFAIAMSVAAVFVGLSRGLHWLARHPFLSGPAYGAVVWLVMNLAVLPLTATPPKSFPPANWPPVFLAHLLCVGLPIALVVRWREDDRPENR